MFQPTLRNEDVKNPNSGLLKNEDYQLPHLLKMKIAFLKLLKTEDLKTPLKNVKKMKTMSCAGSPLAPTVTFVFLLIYLSTNIEIKRQNLARLGTKH